MIRLNLIFLFVSLANIVVSQTTQIPDSNFEAHLVSEGIDTDGVVNGYMLTSDAQATDSLSVGNPSITDFTGLEDFSNLTYLAIANYSGSINLSGLLSLDYFYNFNSTVNSIQFHPNQPLKTITLFEVDVDSIDFSNCPLLEKLSIKYSSLSKINIDSNPLLTSIDINWTNLNLINLSSNTKLQIVSLSANLLSAIDVSDLDSLTNLGIGSNQISELDISSNSVIKLLYIDTNQIQSLDISQNSELQFLYCSENDLNQLNVKNGNNLLIAGFGFTSKGNPNLTCIEVDSVAYCSANWTNIDPQSFFSLDCDYDLSVSAVELPKMSVFPNPASDQFTLQVPSEIKCKTVQIFNTQGQVVFEEILQNQSEFYMKVNLFPGFYLIRVSTDSGVYTEQLLIR